MSDIDYILTTRTEDLRPELQIPSGTWRFRCRAVTKKVDTKGDPYFVVTLQPMEAQADVDSDKLSEWLAEGDEDAVVFHSVRGGQRAIEAQAKRIAEAVGARNLQALTDTELLATLAYEPNKNDPDRPWARISAFSKVDG